MGYEGKAQPWSRLGETDEAKVVLENALSKARSQEKRGHEAQLLILLGKLAAQKGDRQQAVKYLEDAGQFATQAQFYRMEADAISNWLKSIVMRGILPTAEGACHSGSCRKPAGWRSLLCTSHLTMLADLKARRGHFAERERSLRTGGRCD